MQIVLDKRFPCVSVIVPTYNSGLTLDFCLKAVKDQIYPNIEVIVVDNYSKDDTVNIAKKYGAKAYLAKSTPCQARNFGIKESQGKYVLTLDSDIKLMPRAIEECVEKCETEKFDAIHIPVITIGNGFWAKCVAFEDLLHMREPDILIPTFFSRSTWDAVGGEDCNLIAGEDWDLWVRLTRNHVRSTFIESIQRHYGFIDLANYLGKKYRWYKTFDRYVAKHKSFALKQEALLLFRWQHHKKSLIRKYPRYFLGFLVLRMMRYLLMFVALRSAD
jgi:glycosyltransferase involved in cell wall biosynthesis